jgi:hypothetical protein
MITMIIATALVVGTVKEVSTLYNKAQQVETLKKELKFRKGQIDLLLTAKSIAQHNNNNNLNNK